MQGEGRRDIGDRKDILLVLDAFYSEAAADALIGHFFTRVVPLDLQKHIPQIADFWEAVLLDARGYGKNVMAIHRHIHGQSAITKAHLDRWVALFTAAVAAHFEGPKAELAKQRALSVATLMNIHLHHPQIRKL